MSDSKEATIIVRKKGFWSVNEEGEQVLTLPLGGSFNAGKISDLPQNSIDHCLEYGFRQKLSDAGAMPKGSTEDDRMEGMQKRFDQLASGDLTRVNAGKGAVKISKDAIGKLSEKELALLEKITGRKLG